MRDTDKRKTLLPRISPQAVGSFLSALLAIGAVALIAVGVGLVFFPAGLITAGLGSAVLQWHFFEGK